MLAMTIANLEWEHSQLVRKFKMSQNADGFMKIWAKDVAPFLDSKTGAFNAIVSGDIKFW